MLLSGFWIEGAWGPLSSWKLKPRVLTFKLCLHLKSFLYASNLLTTFLKQHQLKENLLFSFWKFSLGEDGNCKIHKDSC